MDVNCGGGGAVQPSVLGFPDSSLPFSLNQRVTVSMVERRVRNEQ